MSRRSRHSADVRASADALLDTAQVRSELIAGFRAQLALYPDHLIANVALERASSYGRRAARAAIAPAIWVVRGQERWDTGEAVAHLGISRQALAKRVANGTLIGLPGKGTTYYPVWQFDLSADPPRVRPAIAAALTAWAEEAGRVDPFAITAWAGTEQTELGDATPIALLDKGTADADERVVFSARVAAARLAQ
jgi:hypothetical protein